MVRIVTDSTCDIPKELIEQYGITVVPLYVNFGDESYHEGVDISTEDIIARIETGGSMPKTSQPSPGDFLKVYEEILASGDSIISLHMSGKLSGTVHAARTAKEILGVDNIYVVDTNFVSMGLGHIVLRATEAAIAGATIPEILELVDRIIQKLSIYFVVGTLEYLERGGRIGMATAFLGSLLKISPILYIDKEGIVVPIEKTRGKNKAIERIVELIEEKYGRTELNFRFLYGNEPLAVEKLKSSVENSYRLIGQPPSSALGAVVICHAGPDVFGVIVSPE